MEAQSVLRTQIRHSYRHLYRHLLQAVQYSGPARFVARDRLRQAFRKGGATDYDHESIARTLEFLRGAAESTGMEHHILKNILHVWYWKKQSQMRRIFRQEQLATVVAQQEAYAHFNMTLKMLNSSLGLCLR